MKPRIVPLGDSSALALMGNEIDLDINQRVHALAKLIEASAIEGIIETVPSYAALLVHYDPLILSFSQIKTIVQEKISQIRETVKRKARQARPEHGRRVEVPVRYGGEHGVDLESVARHLRLRVEDVIRIHSEKIYTVYMMGFTPGYPYMGKLDGRLIMPRLETPRTRVPTGTVAIAGSQTGIYSVESPGGWNLIGWTPLKLFDPESDSPFLFSPGDEVKFIPV
ncbi:MAG: 5-oxoprolinase subunit PxpB [Anaerolineales bacterium]|nr:MAG: 5-oxoprolinase subunit PxpB [Anaerolineales bacterium]